MCKGRILEGLRGSFNFSCNSEYVVFWEFYFICKEDFNEEEMSINLFFKRLYLYRNNCNFRVYCAFHFVEIQSVFCLYLHSGLEFLN